MKAGIHSKVYDVDIQRQGYVRYADMIFLSHDRVRKAFNWYIHKYRKPISKEYVIANLEDIEHRMLPLWKRLFTLKGRGYKEKYTP